MGGKNKSPRRSKRYEDSGSSESDSDTSSPRKSSKSKNKKRKKKNDPFDSDSSDDGSSDISSNDDSDDGENVRFNDRGLYRPSNEEDEDINIILNEIRSSLRSKLLSHGGKNLRKLAGYYRSADLDGKGLLRKSKFKSIR